VSPGLIEEATMRRHQRLRRTRAQQDDLDVALVLVRLLGVSASKGSKQTYGVDPGAIAVSCPISPSLHRPMGRQAPKTLRKIAEISAIFRD
jgi:hypothetical protein